MRHYLKQNHSEHIAIICKIRSSQNTQYTIPLLAWTQSVMNSDIKQMIMKFHFDLIDDFIIKIN